MCSRVTAVVFKWSIKSEHVCSVCIFLPACCAWADWHKGRRKRAAYPSQTVSDTHWHTVSRWSGLLGSVVCKRYTSILIILFWAKKSSQTYQVLLSSSQAKQFFKLKESSQLLSDVLLKWLVVTVFLASAFISPAYLCTKSSLLSELSMEPIKRLINQVREYWYMGSMLARSAMEKNKMAEWMAIGV